MVPARYGCTASVLILVITGAITNSVRNSARPTSTWLGGVWPAPIAWRRIASTITMRVNAVIMSRMAGSSVSTVIRIRICSVSEYVWPPSGLVVTVTAGMPVAAAASAMNGASRPSTTSSRDARHGFHLPRLLIEQVLEVRQSWRLGRGGAGGASVLAPAGNTCSARTEPCATPIEQVGVTDAHQHARFLDAERLRRRAPGCGQRSRRQSGAGAARTRRAPR